MTNRTEITTIKYSSPNSVPMKKAPPIEHFESIIQIIRIHLFCLLILFYIIQTPTSSLENKRILFYFI